MDHTKSSVSDAVGAFFENRLLRGIPNLVDHRESCNTPDFKFGEIWIEAKAGHNKPGYGVRLKKYQFRQHETFNPMIYALGFHDFSQARVKLSHLPTKDMTRTLDRNGTITELFFVSPLFVEQIWTLDHIVSSKRGAEYCRLPASKLNAILTNNTMKRGSVTLSAEELYGIRYYAGCSGEPVGYMLTKADYKRVCPLLDILNWSVISRK